MVQRHYLWRVPRGGDINEGWSPIIDSTRSQLREMAIANQATANRLGLLDDGPNTPRRRRILQEEASRLTD
eukprot:8145289-Karenia_brevis.AAC.1